MSDPGPFLRVWGPRITRRAATVRSRRATADERDRAVRELKALQRALIEWTLDRDPGGGGRQGEVPEG